MIDVVKEIEGAHREVGEGRIAAGDGKAVRLRRDFDAPIEDVWDALTDPERISRWFLPVSGDFRLGGHYQFEGQAGGDIVACDRPNRLRVTWVFGEPASPSHVSELELRLSTVDGTTRFELEHTAIVPDEMWGEYGPGAVGVGWDMGLLGLSLHLGGGAGVGDPTAWQLSDEGIDYATRSSNAWGAASVAAGTDPEAAARGVANTITFYTVDPTAGGD